MNNFRLSSRQWGQACILPGWLVVMSVGMIATVLSAHADSAWKRDMTVRSARIDLDGDGRRENIELVQQIRADEYKLVVNGQVVFDHTRSNEAAEGFYIADIDRADKQKEIVVQSMINPDVSGGMIYAFRKGRLQRVSSGVIADPTFPGNGEVRESMWLSFWEAVVRYRLNSRHQLKLVRQRFYPVGIKTQVFRALPLHAYHRPAKTLLTLPVGHKVTIVKSDLKNWYQLKTSSGATGWAEESVLLHSVRGGFVAAG